PGPLAVEAVSLRARAFRPDHEPPGRIKGVLRLAGAEVDLVHRRLLAGLEDEPASRFQRLEGRFVIVLHGLPARPGLRSVTRQFREQRSRMAAVPDALVHHYPPVRE